MDNPAQTCPSAALVFTLRQGNSPFWLAPAKNTPEERGSRPREQRGPAPGAPQGAGVSQDLPRWKRAHVRTLNEEGQLSPSEAVNHGDPSSSSRSQLLFSPEQLQPRDPVCLVQTHECCK